MSYSLLEVQVYASFWSLSCSLFLSLLPSLPPSPHTLSHIHTKCLSHRKRDKNSNSCSGRRLYSNTSPVTTCPFTEKRGERKREKGGDRGSCHLRSPELHHQHRKSGYLLLIQLQIIEQLGIFSIHMQTLSAPPLVDPHHPTIHHLLLPLLAAPVTQHTERAACRQSLSRRFQLFLSVHLSHIGTGEDNRLNIFVINKTGNGLRPLLPSHKNKSPACLPSSAVPHATIPDQRETLGSFAPGS